MTTILLWLAQYVGLGGIKRLVAGLVKWTVRLVLLAALALGLWWLIDAVSVNRQWQIYAEALAGAGAGAWLLWKGFGWWRRRRNGADAGERTIDGKLVPEKLAVAALGLPPRSPGADDVLRGLPDYGKTLLKLNAGEFEYVPEIPGEVPEPLEEPAVKRSWWALAQQFDDYLMSRVNDIPAKKIVAGSLLVGVLIGGAEHYGIIHTRLGSLVQGVFHAGDTAGTWRDTDTGLLWTARDNGPEPVESFSAAKSYCESLDVSGIRGWRVPGIAELRAAKDKGRLRNKVVLSERKELFWGQVGVLEDLGAMEDLGTSEFPSEEAAKKLTVSAAYSVRHVLCVQP